jgi:late competence protein required for DNA uptake (superfamily II DNA/RNA helicase)
MKMSYHNHSLKVPKKKVIEKVKNRLNKRVKSGN